MSCGDRTVCDLEGEANHFMLDGPQAAPIVDNGILTKECFRGGRGGGRRGGRRRWGGRGGYRRGYRNYGSPYYGYGYYPYWYEPSYYAPTYVVPSQPAQEVPKSSSQAPLAVAMVALVVAFFALKK